MLAFCFFACQEHLASAEVFQNPLSKRVVSGYFDQCAIDKQDGCLQLNALDSSRNSLTGGLPSSWGALNNSQYVNLASNKFTGTVPSSWSSWSQVRTSSIATQLVYARRSASSAMCHACMQVLHASFADNQLAGGVPMLSNITLALNMSSNRFTTVSFETLPNSLQLLYLANNSLSGTLASTLPADLSLMDISYNNLSGPLPKDVLPGLSVLNVSHNAFTQSLPRGWAKYRAWLSSILTVTSSLGHCQQHGPHWGTTLTTPCRCQCWMQIYKAICHNNGFNSSA